MQVSLQAFKNWVYSNPSQAAQTLDQATTLFKAIVAAEVAGVGYFYSSLSKKTIFAVGTISLVTAFFLVYTRNWIAKVEEEQTKKSENVNDKGNTPLHHDVKDTPQVEGEQKERIEMVIGKGYTPHSVEDLKRAWIAQTEELAKVDGKGYTRLHHAVIDAPIEEIKSLLQQGANIHAKVQPTDQSQEDNWGNTPLHFAAKYGRLDVVTLLVGNGCNVLEENVQTENSIHMAGDTGWKEIFDLLKKQANIEDDDYAMFYTVFDLAKFGYLENLKLHMGKNVNIQTTDEDGLTLLHHAAGRGKLDIVEYLVTENADKEAKTPDNLTPYMLAYRNGWNEVTDFLKSLECSTDLGTTTFIWQELADSWLAEYEGTCRHGANPSGRDAQGKTALHYLSRPSQVKRILELDQSLANAVDQNGNTPLHCVQTVASLDILCENGALIDAENRWDQTPLNCALEQGNLKVADALIQRNAKLNASATNEEGEPFLHCFIRKEKGDAGIELLKTLFAKYEVNFDLRNSKGETCLHVAAAGWDSNNMIAFLLEQKADLINLKDHLGRTALHRTYGLESRQNILINAGADLSIKDDKGLTPEALHQQKKEEKQEQQRRMYEACHNSIFSTRTW
jgi:ankyrin repeat protein